MNTIPHKVVYTKQEFAELKKEFENKEKDIKELSIKLDLLGDFLKRLNGVIDFDQSVFSANQLFLDVNHASDKRPKLIGK